MRIFLFPGRLLALSLPCLLALAALLPAGNAPPIPGAAAIMGQVRFTGTVPPDQKIMTTDGATILHNDLVVDPKTRGLRYVFVTLEGAKAQPKVANAKPVEMDQKDMVFIPRVVAVQYGQPVVFTNSDLCNHSVMTATKVKENQFNIFTPANQPYSFTFAPQERPVVIGCSIHAWMRAWVHVVEHPWFAVTDAQGKFTLRNLPPGKHTLVFHHADTGKQDKRSIELKPGETGKLLVEWDRAGK
jgi:plastocyanin